jgi:hypothetical protein
MVWMAMGTYPSRAKRFFSTPVSRMVPGPTQPPIQRILGVRQLGRGTDCSPPFSAEVKNGRYTSTATCVFMGWQLI